MIPPSKVSAIIQFVALWLARRDYPELTYEGFKVFPLLDDYRKDAEELVDCLNRMIVKAD